MNYKLITQPISHSKTNETYAHDILRIISHGNSNNPLVPTLKSIDSTKKTNLCIAPEALSCIDTINKIINSKLDLILTTYPTAQAPSTSIRASIEALAGANIELWVDISTSEQLNLITESPACIDIFSGVRFGHELILTPMIAMLPSVIKKISMEKKIILANIDDEHLYSLSKSLECNLLQGFFITKMLLPIQHLDK